MTPAAFRTALEALGAGYNVRDLDGPTEAWCVWVAHADDDTYDTQVWQNEDGTYTTVGFLSLVWHGTWDDVSAALAADRTAVGEFLAPRTPAPPVWSETLDELGAWRSDTLCASAWLFVALAVAFLSGYVVGSWT